MKTPQELHVQAMAFTRKIRGTKKAIKKNDLLINTPEFNRTQKDVYAELNHLHRQAMIYQKYFVRIKKRKLPAAVIEDTGYTKISE